MVTFIIGCQSDTHEDDGTGSTRVRSSCVSHRQRSRLVGGPVNALVLNVATVGSALLTLRLEVDKSAVGGATGARAFAFRILGVGAAELVHEVRDDAVEMYTIVEPCETLV